MPEAAGFPVQVIAHTGTLYEYPENTMAGFKRSIEAGADMIEVDLQLSKDGVAMVFHDETLYRMTDGAGYIADKTYEELRRYPVSVAMLDAEMSMGVELKQEAFANRPFVARLLERLAYGLRHWL